MPLPVSTLSVAARHVADFVGVAIQANANNVSLSIGHPAAAAPDSSSTDHRLNFFLHRLEDGGFDADVTPGDPWHLRLRCLVTAFGVVEDGVAAGENDLRLLGEVLRVFHETPVLPDLALASGATTATVRPRVIFSRLGPEELNQIWSTQGDVSYRPSVAYEIALVPVLPRELRVEAPLAGGLGMQSRADEAGRYEPFSGEIQYPRVPSTQINTAESTWRPRLAFVETTIDGPRATEVLTLELPLAPGFEPEVWVAGEAAANVTLRWEIWDTQDGWRRFEPMGGEPVVQASGPLLDPEAAAGAVTVAAPLPVTDAPGQAVLSALRSVQRPDGSTVEVRSNPLLVTLHGAGP
ncbi:MAG: DUF4255 domain-containing protein [Acidobacteriota bacterium]